MKQLPCHDIGATGIGDHNTVSTGPDNGANANLRRIFWQSMGHATFTEAVNNFLSRLGGRADTLEKPRSAGNLNLAGHGNEGFLTTGAGQTGPQDYKTNVLLFWSAPWWGLQFERIASKNFPMLYIYSCHTGAGDRGADFLFALAGKIGHPAAGRTGFLYSNPEKLWFENGSTWQVATPDTRPAPINPPSPHVMGIQMADEILIADGGTVTALAPADIVAVEVTKFTGAPQRASVRIADDTSAAFLRALCATEPRALPGIPMAMVTATVAIKYRTKTGEAQRTFTIYNDRLAVDHDAGIAYYTSTDFAAMLASLT